MPVDSKVSDMMAELDACSGVMEEWAYKKLCDKLMVISNDLDNKQTCARRTLARDMIVEKPECIGTLAVYPFMHDPKFMQSVVRAKAIDLQDFSTRFAAVLGSQWKQQLTDAVLEDCSPELYLRVRLGILSLLMAHSGFLTQIVTRLEALKITPVMLFASDLNAPFHGEDTGEGPTALNLLHHEPRLLRWLLGREPTSSWPLQGPKGVQPAFVRRLIRVANASGGDDSSINASCECPMCRGLVIPTIEDYASSTAPSDCEEDEAGYQSPVPLPPVTHHPPERVQRTHAARARASTRPYQRDARE